MPPIQRLRDRRRLLGSVLVLGALSLVSVSASAQSPAEIQQARTLYSQGLTQEAASDWAGALASFEKVARIRMTPQVRFHIARCKEQLGRLNEALGGYRLAEHEAATTDGVPESVLQEVRTAREALEKRVPRLIIERGEGADSAKIALDGVELGQAQIGREVNVDPGPHVIKVTLPDGRRFERTVQVKEGEQDQVMLDVPPDLQPAVDEEAGAGKGEDQQTGSGAAFDTRDSAPAASGSPMPWIIGGLGVASLAASGVFYMLRNQANSDLDSECINDVCPDTLEDTQSRGENYSMLTGVTLGIGIVGVSVAAIWLLTGSSGGEAKAASGKHLRFDVGFDPRRPSVGLAGHF
ncbi:MAG: hypothetical protein KC766_14380 [Myxococcales bacterium]|nr:hypothetical protein [Myxococcales bacterium]